MWDVVHVDLIGPYINYIRHDHTGSATITSDLSLACIIMNKPNTGWFRIIKVPMFDLDKVTDGNNELIDKSSARTIQLFNKV